MADTIGTIRYSYRFQTNMDAKPIVTGSDMWHVHYVISDTHRTTWDISNGQVVGCGDERWAKLPRRNYAGWIRTDANYPLPISLQGDSTMANTRFEVVKVWEWEDKDGEPHTRIEPGDGYTYEDMGAANSAAWIFNGMRSQAQRSAGMFYEAMTADEIRVTVQA